MTNNGNNNGYCMGCRVREGRPHRMIQSWGEDWVGHCPVEWAKDTMEGRGYYPLPLPEDVLAYCQKILA